MRRLGLALLVLWLPITAAVAEGSVSEKRGRSVTEARRVERKKPNQHRAAKRPRSVKQASGRVLFGDQRVESKAGHDAAGRVLTLPFSNKTTGIATSIDVYVGSRSKATKLIAGIYSYRKGHPAKRLTFGRLESPTAGAWNTVRVTPVRVAAGLRYGIAVLGEGGILYFHGRTAESCRSESSHQTKHGALPMRWKHGARRHFCVVSAYVRGTIKAAGNGSGLGAPPGRASGPPPSQPPPPHTSSYVCTEHVTTSTFESAFSSASGGAVLCLAPGSYGSFNGGSKPAPGVVITSDASAGANSANVSFRAVTFSGGAWVTLDTLTIGAGTQGDALYISGSPTSLTFSNDAFDSYVEIEGLQNSNHQNVLFDDDTFDWATPTTCDGPGVPGLLYLGYNGAGHAGVTVEHSDFGAGPGQPYEDCDGIHTGTALDILDNTFHNICETSSADNHTDNIQFQGAVGGLVAGNYVHEVVGGSGPEGSACTTQGITSYDGGTQGVTIEDNVVDIGRPWGIEWYGDIDSVIRHNTIVYRPTGTCEYNDACGYIDIDCKPSEFSCGNNAAYGTQVYDNLATVTVQDGAKTARDDHNMSAQSVRYSGGSNPPPNGGFASFFNYLLAPGSPGGGAADDGTNLGVTGPA